MSLVFQYLVNGRIDAVIADKPMALVYVSRNPNQLRTPGDVFIDEYYSIAVCKNRPDLVEKINRGLAALKAEGLMDQLT
jgi:polar amino acid transport system substrate-binding protein